MKTRHDDNGQNTTKGEIAMITAPEGMANVAMATTTMITIGAGIGIGVGALTSRLGEGVGDCVCASKCVIVSECLRVSKQVRACKCVCTQVSVCKQVCVGVCKEVSVRV